MIPAIKAEWLRRLRSGDIKQGTGTLHNPLTGAQCCLGVLTEMAREEGVVIRRAVVVDSTAYDYGSSSGDCDEFGYLLSAVREWAGLPVEFGAAGALPNGKSLAKLNDSGRTFAEIADIIEEHF